MPSKLKHRKLLLMGRSGAGKSSMRSIIFSNYVARDVRRLGTTNDVEHSNIRFLNSLTLNLWDCGGQDRLMDTFLETQREDVFSNVAVLVYVFDVDVDRGDGHYSADLAAFERVCGALGEFNKVAGRGGVGTGTVVKEGKEGSASGCRVWVCIHKMDLVKGPPGVSGDEYASRIFNEKCADISKRAGAFEEKVEFFPTSIWDQSLYKAWTKIIYHLIPNAGAIEALLGKLTGVLGARECTLIERTTCLTIATCVGKSEGEEQNPNEGRTEVMSGILKGWRGSLSRHTNAPTSSTHFTDFQLKTATFFFFITRLTENMNIAVVMPPSEQYMNAAKTNVILARPKFRALDISSRRPPGGFMEGAARDVKVGDGSGTASWGKG